MERESATTPDLILSNNKIYHNIQIDQGPITTSDHIPIIVTISTKAITVPPVSKYNLNKANWEKFKNIIDNKMEEVTLQETPEHK